MNLNFLVEIVVVAVKLLQKAADFPDWKLASDVKLWLDDVSGPLSELIALVAGQIDNRVGVAEPVTAAALTAAVRERLAADGVACPDDIDCICDRAIVETLAAELPKAADDDKAELDPAAIIAIVMAVVQVVKWIINRRRNG